MLVGVSTVQRVTLEQFGDVLDTYVLLWVFGKERLQFVLQSSYQEKKAKSSLHGTPTPRSLEQRSLRWTSRGSASLSNTMGRDFR